jgi:hypothetical protein
MSEQNESVHAQQGTEGPPPPRFRATDPREKEFALFEANFVPMEKDPTPGEVVDSLLKRPASVIYEVVKGRHLRTGLLLAAIGVVCMLCYGGAMGAFSGGHQFWAVPIKATIGIFLSALICLPSLYIFVCLSGGKQSLAQIACIFLAALALSGILLLGFVPVTWVFSQSTNAAGSMAAMHMVFWAIGIYFGLTLLRRALGFLGGREMAAFKTWAIVFIVVVMQMCTTLRPLVGEYSGFREKGKKFFLTHWSESLGHAGRGPARGR